MAVSSTLVGTFGGGGAEWVSVNRSGSGLGSTVYSTPSGRMCVVELRSTGSNREIQIRTGLSGLTVTLQTAGTYYQVMQPNSTLSMVSQVTLVRRIEFDA